MATTTPNFGWSVPTSSDLVKNGATAIETLGDSIDASLVDLKGGTTGQVLAKATGTDMDFTWTTPSAGSTYNGNAIINGGMDIWQRGTSFTAPSVYTADRWFAGSQTTFTRSRQASGLTGFQYSMRVQRDLASTNTAGGAIYYNLESADSYRFAGQTATISFYAKAGANYSPTSSAFNYLLYTGTGTDQRRDQSTGFTGETLVVNSTVTLTTSWQRFSYTAAIGSTATEIALGFYAGTTGVAGANDWFEITGIQMELGSTVSTFKRSNGAGGQIQGELAACQRYYVKDDKVGVNAYTGSGTNCWGLYQFPTTMRITPTMTQTGGATASQNTSATTFTQDTSNSNTFKMGLYFLAGASTTTTYLYRPVEWSAEL